MKKLTFISALFIVVALFSACQAPKTPEPISETPVEATDDENLKMPADLPKPVKIVINSPLAKIGDIEYSDPKIIDTLTVLKDQVEKTIKTLDPKGMTEFDYKGGIIGSFYFYEAGKIKVDPYKDWSLLVLSKRCDGPCPAIIYRFAWDPQSNKVVNLTSHSYQPTEEDYGYMDEEMKYLLDQKDSKKVFESLKLPTSISIPDTGEVVELAEKEIDLTEQKYSAD